jgi:glucosamine-phosphate N-acetyltransferase
MITFRKIQETDYDSVYSLLQQLTEVGDYNETKFLQCLRTLPSNIHMICMCEDAIIVGIGTIIVEQKIIHAFSKVGHIEDVVIDSKYVGKGYGKQLIGYLTYLGKQNKCYKVILDCSQHVKGFYEKCGYTEKNISMGVYF